MAPQPRFQLSLCTKRRRPEKSEEESPTQMSAVMLLESLSTVWPLIPQETHCDFDMLYSLGTKVF